MYYHVFKNQKFKKFCTKRDKLRIKDVREKDEEKEKTNIGS